MIRLVAVVGFLCLISLPACDQSFDPLVQYDGHFSMYGVLDLSADTQWLRVTPIRQSVGTSSSPIDAVVTLEDLSTGAVVTMRDTIMLLTSPDPNRIDDFWAANFWTAEPLLPGRTYKVVARRSDGAESSALVPVPPRPERIVVRVSVGGAARPDTVRVEGVRHLALANLMHYSPPECLAPNPFYDEFQPQSRVDAGQAAPRFPIFRSTLFGVPCLTLPPTHQAFFWSRRATPPAGPHTVQKWDLRIVVSGAPWPVSADLTEATITRFEFGSNVEEGTGFIGGISTEVVPWESCALIGPLPFGVAFCDLLYDSASAMLTGQVVDIACRNRPAPWIGLNLRAAGEVTFRPIFTDVNGEYRIGALRPGVPYSITMGSTGYGPIDVQVVLEAGERRKMDMTVRGNPPIPLACL